MSEKKLTVIIPTYNEEAYIENNIKSLLECNFPKEQMEIIYVDGNSEDATKEIIQKYQSTYPFIRLLINEKRITPVAANLGIKNAKGKFFTFIGAHSSLKKDYLSRLVAEIERLNVDAVGGLIKTDIVNRTSTSVAIIKVLTNKFGVGNAEYRISDFRNTVHEVDTAGYLCYNRQNIINIGGYDEKLIRNQDIELNKRIKKSGGKIFLVPDTYAVYFARELYKELAKNNFANGLWNILTVYYTKDYKSLGLRHFIPLIFLLSLLIPTILSFFWLPFIIISGCSFLSYNLLIIYQAIKMNDKETNIWSIIKAFYTLHFSYGMGSLIGTFKVLKLKLFGE